MTAFEQVARALPDYDITGELGRGGFGVVWAGVHRQLGRPVAVKELPTALSDDPGVKARFVVEAKLLASFDFPHIVPVYDFVERDGLCLLVMEYLTGGSVWDLSGGGPLTVDRACAIALATCAGVHYAHTHQVLHRDVKPENLLFSRDGVLKVGDFGIAKVIGGADALATGGGEILGTPAYMAPEQAMGERLTATCDVYAVAAVLYELLAGRPPFSDEGGGLAVAYRHVYEQPVPLLEVAPAVPVALAGIVMSGLARDPSERPPDAEGLGVEIALAARSVLGAGWLAAAGVPLLAAGPILESAAGTASVQVPRGGSVLVPRPGSVIVPAPTSVRPAPASVTPAPSGLVQRPARRPIEVSGHLVPLAEVLVPSPLPRRPLAVAAALAVAGTLAALVGLGAPQPAADASGASVAGTPLAAGRPVRLDLAQPVPYVAGPLPAGTQVGLRLSVLGVPLASLASVPVTVGAGGVSAELRGSGSRFLAAGRLTGRLDVYAADGTRTGSTAFVARAARPPWTTIPGVLDLVGILVVLAYAESLLRGLRSAGRMGPVSALSLAGLGAATGVVLTGLVWVAGLREPTWPRLVLDALLWAAAAECIGVVVAAAGTRSRARRVNALLVGLRARGGLSPAGRPAPGPR